MEEDLSIYCKAEPEEIKNAPKMRPKGGIMTNDRQEILNVCTDFYQELYSSKLNEAKPNTISPDIY